MTSLSVCDRTGGQIGNNDSADDVRNVDLTRIHYLTGPFEIEGAQPGDILLVEIMDVQVRLHSNLPFLERELACFGRPLPKLARDSVWQANRTRPPVLKRVENPEMSEVAKESETSHSKNNPGALLECLTGRTAAGSSTRSTRQRRKQYGTLREFSVPPGTSPM